MASIPPLDANFTIRRLGDALVPSPLRLSHNVGDHQANYVSDAEFVLYDIEVDGSSGDLDFGKIGAFEKAGPREKLFFAPGRVHAAIVTCGGL